MGMIFSFQNYFKGYIYMYIQNCFKIIDKFGFKLLLHDEVLRKLWYEALNLNCIHVTMMMLRL